MNFDNETNILVLAYLGDSVYELFIRKYLIDKDISKIDDLQKEAIKYVSAYGQVNFLNYLIQAKILIDNELDIVRKGRNNKRRIHPKNTDILTYKHSTGFEALIGYLYINDKDRLNEILSYIKELWLCIYMVKMLYMKNY